VTVPYVHSNFDRIEGDYYPTIDKRCVYGFLEHFNPTGLCVDPCAPSGSGIVDTLQECDYKAERLPDAFMDFTADWVVINPPYDRKIVDGIIHRQIQRVADGTVNGVACLLRANFDFAKSRKSMFRDNPFYRGQIKLLFRPWWSESRDAQPIHNYVWQIWQRGDEAKVVLYADGVR
jgi:hypothetical protein